jgi:hypothetical protein
MTAELLLLLPMLSCCIAAVAEQQMDATADPETARHCALQCTATGVGALACPGCTQMWSALHVSECWQVLLS